MEDLREQFLGILCKGWEIDISDLDYKDLARHIKRAIVLYKEKEKKKRLEEADPTSRGYD